MRYDSIRHIESNYLIHDKQYITMCLCYVGTYISSKLHMWKCVEMLNLCQVAKNERSKPRK